MFSLLWIFFIEERKSLIQITLQIRTYSEVLPYRGHFQGVKLLAMDTKIVFMAQRSVHARTSEAYYKQY